MHVGQTNVTFRDEAFLRAAFSELAREDPFCRMGLVNLGCGSKKEWLLAVGKFDGFRLCWSSFNLFSIDVW